MWVQRCCSCFIVFSFPRRTSRCCAEPDGRAALHSYPTHPHGSRNYLIFGLLSYFLLEEDILVLFEICDSFEWRVDIPEQKERFLTSPALMDSCS